MALFELPEWAALAPTFVLAATSLALLVIDSIDPDSTNRPMLAGTATTGALLALAVTGWYLVAGVGDPNGRGIVSLFGTAQVDGTVFGGQLVVDQMSLLFTFIFASVTAMVTVASYDYLRGHSYQAEYYSLVMLAATGMSLMASAASLATVFVSFELLSLSSYALVAFLKKNRGSVEAGLKYFLIGALSSAVFVYGISLVYAVTGSLQLAAVAQAAAGTELVGVLGLGVILVLGGIAFKTAVVPFHFWAPEAYEGAPAPISAFLSSASKAAGFVVAFRVFTLAFPFETFLDLGVDWVLAVQILAVVTMTLGNFAAATQTEVKRMLAYSSVGHAGYALIGLAAITGSNSEIVLGAGMMHLVVYGFMNTGAFLFVALVEYWDVGRTFEDYNGLATRAPVASLAMTVFMFSLAGLPPFGGFASKYILFMGAVNAGFWWLAAVGAVNSALSLYYYSRVVKALWFEDPSDDVGKVGIANQPVGLYAAILFAAVATVALLPAFGPVSDTAVSAASSLLP
ncbi:MULTISPECIES: NADH-quinone oxidoreductase subunit N [Halostella]|uniref:NADH-quinone oxidoreductase subunit N n=1 Tax=Halostella TaxID=1843185 RepID=UPI001080E85B|nr:MULTISPECIES: NADH-quinone oxidoreductase subunit N [Halostella]